MDEGAEAMTLEVSSHGLSLGRLRGVEFDVAIFSNLTQDHLISMAQWKHMVMLNHYYLANSVKIYLKKICCVE